MPKPKDPARKTIRPGGIVVTASLDTARQKLDALWGDVLDPTTAISRIDENVRLWLEVIFNSKTRTYAYALITQLLAKLDDPRRDARCIQKLEDDPDESRFDARSICSKVVVPWERSIGSPLGLKDDPYVNNPMRVSDFSIAFQHKQKDRQAWGALVRLFEHVQGRPEETRPLLIATLSWVAGLRESQVVKYPSPQRASLRDTLTLVNGFLSKRSAGARLQLIGFAVFDSLRKTWGVFDEVTTAPVNASDAATGKPADVVCRRNGKVMLACEVKDRDVNIELMHGTITNARLDKVTELFTLVRGTSAADGAAIDARIDNEFKHGMNVYLLEADGFFALILALIGEPGRQHFIRSVAEGMTAMNLSFETRRDWARALEDM